MLLRLSRCPSKQNWSWPCEASLLTWTDGKEKASSPNTLVSDLPTPREGSGAGRRGSEDGEGGEGREEGEGREGRK